MARGRPTKKGLDWYKKDSHYYEDFKIMDLINEYGPLGNTVFDCLLCMIYREGYYLDLPLEKVCLAVVKAVGSKWVKKHQVMQVIQYCADIGLLERDLLGQSVLTSAGIQRRYAEVTSRNKVNKSLYWLIDENGQLLKNIPSRGISATENRISATENRISATENTQEKKKNKSKNKRENSTAFAAPPSLKDVQAYCKDKSIDPERFYNYYEATGWMQRGVPITNWRALADNWTKTERPRETETPHKPSYDLEAYEKFDIFDSKKEC